MQFSSILVQVDWILHTHHHRDQAMAITKPLHAPFRLLCRLMNNSFLLVLKISGATGGSSIFAMSGSTVA
jgi:hypothetical protein